MKKFIAFLLFIFAASPCAAQWQSAGGNVNTFGTLLAFGVHDATLFASFVNPGGGVFRYVPPDRWLYASNGIDFTQGNITSFASLGSYFFANPSNQLGYSQIILSTDNGLHWNYQIQAAGPVGTNGTYLFGTLYTTPPSIIRSRDSGKTWDSVANFAPDGFAANGACIFASNSTNFLRSTDSGTNWATVSAPINNVGHFAFIGSIMFASHGSIIKSVDSGATWTEITIPRRTVHTLAASAPYLFAGTDSGVFISVDSGANWRNVSDGLTAQPRFYPSATTLIVFDTLLFAGIDAGDGYGYVVDRSIREMTDTTKSAVQEVFLAQSDSLMIYPNPARGLVTIFAGGTSILGISVLNVLGADVLDEPQVREPEISLDLSHLPSGTYFLRIITERGIVLRKIVKEQ